jgi:hypothetical protein
MARLKYKNTFGSQNSKLDLQRLDLFKVTLQLPDAITNSVGPWSEHVEFAVEKFPFPDRKVDMTPIKYMQQTNMLIGGDAATGAVEIPVRYVFAQRTAEVLEKWFYLIRNPITGGVGLTSEVKCQGFVRWLVPNMSKQIADIQGQPLPGEDTMQDGAIYVLEGCLIAGLKFVDADVTQSGFATLSFSLQVDRWYPYNIDALQVLV